MTTGIYLLKFVDWSIYIGQSKNIERRYLQHLNKLKNNSHPNIKLTNKYLKLGAPKLEILLECSAEELDKNEIEAVEIYNSVDNGLNIAPAAGQFPVLKGEKNPFSKNRDDDLVLIVEYLVANINTPLKILAAELGIHYSTVKNIANGSSHTWLSEKIPELYAVLLAHKGKRTINTIGGKGRVYVIKDPEGTVYEVSNIAEFSKNNYLNPGALGQVLRGQAKQHKGWKLAK